MSLIRCYNRNEELNKLREQTDHLLLEASQETERLDRARFTQNSQEIAGLQSQVDDLQLRLRESIEHAEEQDRRSVRALREKERLQKEVDDLRDVQV